MIGDTKEESDREFNDLVNIATWCSALSHVGKESVSGAPNSNASQQTSRSPNFDGVSIRGDENKIHNEWTSKRHSIAEKVVNDNNPFVCRFKRIPKPWVLKFHTFMRSNPTLSNETTGSRLAHWFFVPQIYRPIFDSICKDNMFRKNSWLDLGVFQKEETKWNHYFGPKDNSKKPSFNGDKSIYLWHREIFSYMKHVYTFNSNFGRYVLDKQIGDSGKKLLLFVADPKELSLDLWKQYAPQLIDLMPEGAYYTNSDCTFRNKDFQICSWENLPYWSYGSGIENYEHHPRKYIDHLLKSWTSNSSQVTSSEIAIKKLALLQELLGYSILFVHILPVGPNASPNYLKSQHYQSNPLRPGSFGAFICFNEEKQYVFPVSGVIPGKNGILKLSYASTVFGLKRCFNSFTSALENYQPK